MAKDKKQKSLNRSNYQKGIMAKEGGLDISNFSDVEPEYKKLIDLACKQDLDFYISNSSLIHAKYVIYKIIENTKKQIEIFSSKLDNKLFCDPKIVETINKNKDITMRFLVVNPKKEDIQCFKKLIDSQKIEFVEIKPQETKPFFIVSDNRMVRLESSIDSTKAKINFNDKSLAPHLSKLFSDLWGINPKKIV